MINKENVKERFHIYTGYKQDGSLAKRLQAGEAYLVESDNRTYYVVKMWAFPNEMFYLSQSKDHSNRYTLFAKKVETENSLNFRRPVGCGYLSRDLKSYLEVQFTFPREKVFMSLFPAPTVIDSLLTQGQENDELETA